VLMILSIGLGFLGDLIFLPALLKMFPNILIPSTKDQAEDAQYPRVSRWGRAAGWIIVLFGILMAPKLEAAALSAKDILNKTRLKIETRDESAKVKLVIIESNGDKKVRELFLKSRRKSGQASTIARISRPADVKGMGLLSQIENGTESHWIFLPQSKQVRRVVGSQTQSGVLGSELSAGDMNSEILRGAKAKLVGVNKSSYQIQVNPRRSKAQFTHAILTISKQFLPQKIEYYSGKKPRKTVEFKNYAHFGSIWRPKSLTIRNHLNHRGTDLTLSSLQINKGLKDFEFSQAALKEDMVY
jgi:outer membrane lipoprotein-sorting protein